MLCGRRRLFQLGVAIECTALCTKASSRYNIAEDTREAYRNFKAMITAEMQVQIDLTVEP